MNLNGRQCGRTKTMESILKYCYENGKNLNDIKAKYIPIKLKNGTIKFKLVIE